MPFTSLLPSFFFFFFLVGSPFKLNKISADNFCIPAKHHFPSCALPAALRSGRQIHTSFCLVMNGCICSSKIGRGEIRCSLLHYPCAEVRFLQHRLGPDGFLETPGCGRGRKGVLFNGAGMLSPVVIQVPGAAPAPPCLVPGLSQAVPGPAPLILHLHIPQELPAQLGPGWGRCRAGGCC